VFKEQWDELTKIVDRLKADPRTHIRSPEGIRLIDSIIILMYHVAQQNRRILQLEPPTTTTPPKPEPTLEPIHTYRVRLSDGSSRTVTAIDEHSARLWAYIHAPFGIVVTDVDLLNQ
jgi:hypothetical protein